MSKSGLGSTRLQGNQEENRTDRPIQLSFEVEIPILPRNGDEDFRYLRFSESGSASQMSRAVILVNLFVRSTRGRTSLTGPPYRSDSSFLTGTAEITVKRWGRV